MGVMNIKKFRIPDEMIDSIHKGENPSAHDLYMAVLESRKGDPND